MSTRSKQLSFFLLNKDLEEMGDFISKENGVFISNVMPTNEIIKETDILKIPYLGYYLKYNMNLENIEIEMLNESKYTFNFHDCGSIIEFCPGRLKEGKLRCGRILLQKKIANDPTTLLYEKLVKYISKKHKRMKIDYLYYHVSELTKEWIKNDNGKLVLISDYIIYTKDNMYDSGL